MEVLRREPHAAEIRLTMGELAIINNALNEICHGIDLPEFASRIGAGREEAKQLLAAFGALLRGRPATP
jgi:hypothetical protein